MDLGELLVRLRSSKGPDRALDAAIGQVIGYRRRLATDAEAKREPEQAWLAPDSNEAVRLPFFTSSIDSACEVAKAVAPEHVGAFTRSAEGTAAVAMDDGPVVYGPSPAIALCLAALTIKYERDGDMEIIDARVHH